MARVGCPVFYDSLGYNVYRFRVPLGLSQRLLGESLEHPLPQPTISRIELGYRPADDRVVDELARALGVRREQLLQRPRRDGVLRRRTRDEHDQLRRGTQARRRADARSVERTRGQ